MADVKQERARSRSRSPARRSRSRSPRRNRNDRARPFMGGRRVVVRNIPYEVRWQELKDMFRKDVGDVTYVEMLETPDGKSKGVAVVEFRDPEHAKKAIEQYHQKKIKDRAIIVREEREKDRQEFMQHQNMKERGMGPGMGPGLGPGGMGGGGGGGGMGGGMGPGPGGLPPGINPQILQQLGIEPPITNTVFVANLDYKVTWWKLKDVFKLAGNVIKAEIKEDKNGKSRGMGVVVFEHPMEAVQAVSMFNGQVLYERNMIVRIDKGPEPDKPKLPSGLKSIGMGLGSGGAPLTNISQLGSNGSMGLSDSYYKSDLGMGGGSGLMGMGNLGGGGMGGSGLGLLGTGMGGGADLGLGGMGGLGGGLGSNLGGMGLGLGGSGSLSSGGFGGGSGGFGGGSGGFGGGSGGLGGGSGGLGLGGGLGGSVSDINLGGLGGSSKMGGMSDSFSGNYSGMGGSSYNGSGNLSGLGGLGPSLSSLSAGLGGMGGSSDRLGMGGSGDRLGVGDGLGMGRDRLGLDRMGGLSDRMGGLSDRLGGLGDRMGGMDRMSDKMRDIYGGGRDMRDMRGDDGGRRTTRPDNCTVAVRNLPYSVNWQGLKEHFRDAGDVKFAEIVMDKGRSTGVGYVRFSNEADAQRAISMKNKSRMERRNIDVSLHRN